MKNQTNPPAENPSVEEMVKTLRTSLREGVDGCGYWRDLHEEEAFKIADLIESQDATIKELEKENEGWEKTYWKGNDRWEKERKTKDQEIERLKGVS